MTPACRVLDFLRVGYTVHPYDRDPATTSFGEEAAAALGVDEDRIFKTLMTTLDTGELVVAIVPVSSMLDLKALAAAMGTKKASMATVEAAERSSGYVAGGISPFGQRTPRRTAIDEIATFSNTIFVSGGRRGLDIEVAPADLITVTASVVAPIAAPSS